VETLPQAGEYLVGTYRQLAFVSAVLGGFSCAFLGVMLAAGDNRRLAGFTVALATLGSIALVVTSVLGSFLVVALAAVGPATFADVPGGVLRAASWLMVAFDLGVACLLLAVGVSGWLRSRLVGWVSTLAMAGGLVLLAWAASLLGLGWGALVR
jgi:hypothetical protein